MCLREADLDGELWIALVSAQSFLVLRVVSRYFYSPEGAGATTNPKCAATC